MNNDIIPPSSTSNVEHEKYDLLYVQKHIENLLNKFAEEQKLKDKVYVENILNFFKSINIPLKDTDELFKLDVSMQDMSYFYWIYKINYTQWLNIETFKEFLNTLNQLVQNTGKINISCHDIEKLKITLSILYYIDRIKHN